jgi:hypothetical protein
MSAAFIRGKKNHQPPPERTFLRSAYSGFCWIPPVVRRLFEVNSEPHTGARPSVRLCVGLKSTCRDRRGIFIRAGFGEVGIVNNERLNLAE